MTFFSRFCSTIYNSVFPKDIEEDLYTRPNNAHSPKRLKLDDHNNKSNEIKNNSFNRTIPIKVVNDFCQDSINQHESRRTFSNLKESTVDSHKRKLSPSNELRKNAHLFSPPKIQQCYVPGPKRSLSPSHYKRDINKDKFSRSHLSLNKKDLSDENCRPISTSQSSASHSHRLNKTTLFNPSDDSLSKSYLSPKKSQEDVILINDPDVDVDEQNQSQSISLYSSQNSHISLDSHSSSDEDVILIKREPAPCPSHKSNTESTEEHFISLNDGQKVFLDLLDSSDDEDQISIIDHTLQPTNPLSEEMNEEIDQILSRDMDDVVVEGFKLSITRTELETLCPENWLSDMIINFYLQLVSDRSRRTKSDLPKVAAVTSFFYPKLIQSGYPSVRSWSRRRNLLSKDLIFIPLHFTNHWALICVDLRSKTITYYDSLELSSKKKRYMKALNHIMEFLFEESLDKRYEPLESKNWLLTKAKEIPHQTNNFDCGVFVCMYAEYLSMDESFTFTQSDMPLFRRRIMLEIIRKNLLR